MATITEDTVQLSFALPSQMQGAYSHGLESIYSLEKVDAKTIRRFTPSSPQVKSKKVTISKSKKTRIAKYQLELDYGAFYARTIDPLCLEIPIEMLGLQKSIEKSLYEAHVHILRDLVTPHYKLKDSVNGISDNVFLDIKYKVKDLIGEKSLEPVTCIDFVAIIYSLFGKLDRKTLYVGLEPFKLADLISLLPSESVEVKRYSENKKEELKKAFRNYANLPEIKAKAHEMIKKIIESLFCPWMRMRNGLATGEELLERLDLLSECPQWTKPVMYLLETLYCCNSSIFLNELVSIHPDIFAIDHSTAEEYKRVIALAISYFYKPQVYFPFAQLTKLISTELAKAWQAISQAFLEKSLLLSPDLRIRKASNLQLVVKLS